MAECLFFPPSIQLLSAKIPVGDDVVHVTHEDRVVRKIEKAGLLAQRISAVRALNGYTRKVGNLVYKS